MKKTTLDMLTARGREEVVVAVLGALARHGDPETAGWLDEKFGMDPDGARAFCVEVGIPYLSLQMLLVGAIDPRDVHAWLSIHPTPGKAPLRSGARGRHSRRKKDAMKLTLTIVTDNAAFEDNPTELGEILRALSRMIDADGLERFSIPLRDSNGNIVGRARLH